MRNNAERTDRAAVLRAVGRYLGAPAMALSTAGVPMNEVDDQLRRPHVARAFVAAAENLLGELQDRRRDPDDDRSYEEVLADWVLQYADANRMRQTDDLEREAVCCLAAEVVDQVFDRKMGPTEAAVFLAGEEKAGEFKKIV